MTCILPGSSYPAAMSPDCCGRILGHWLDPDMNCGSGLLLALPDDALALVSGLLNPIDLCNFSLCCGSLNGLAASDKVWFMQCEKLGLIDARDLSWRKVVDSYKAICRFLVKVKPLIGIWVHQNPEKGNVVYVMWGFMSAVGCRVLPQELGPLGFDGPLLWVPVFEIIGDSDGSPLFFLHGRQRNKDYCYPGFLKAMDDDCDVLLLEAEPQKDITSRAVRASVDDLGIDSSRTICRAFFVWVTMMSRILKRPKDTY